MSHVWLSYQGYAVHTDLTLDRPTRVVTKSPCVAPGGDVEAYVASDDVGAMCPHLEVYQCRVVVSVLGGAVASLLRRDDADAEPSHDTAATETAAPQEPPHKSPSSRINLLIMTRLSVSFDFIQ